MSIENRHNEWKFQPRAVAKLSGFQGRTQNFFQRLPISHIALQVLVIPTAGPRTLPAAVEGSWLDQLETET